MDATNDSFSRLGAQQQHQKYQDSQANHQQQHQSQMPHYSENQQHQEKQQYHPSYQQHQHSQQHTSLLNLSPVDRMGRSPFVTPKDLHEIDRLSSTENSPGGSEHTTVSHRSLPAKSNEYESTSAHALKKLMSEASVDVCNPKKEAWHERLHQAKPQHIAANHDNTRRKRAFAERDFDYIVEENSYLMQLLEEMKEAVKEVERGKERLKTENFRLRCRNMSENGVTSDEVTAGIEGAFQAIDDLEKQLRSLTSEHHQALQTIQTLQASSSDLLITNKRLNQQLSELKSSSQANIESVEAQLKLLTTDSRALQSKSEELLAEALSQKKKGWETAQSLEKRVVELEAENETIRSKENALVAKIDSLQSGARRLVQDLKDTQARLEEAEDTIEHLSSEQSQLDSSRGQALKLKDNLQSKLEAQSKEYRELAARWEELNKVHQALLQNHNQLRANYEQLGVKCEGAVQTEIALRQRLNDLSTTRMDGWLGGMSAASAPSDMEFLQQEVGRLRQFNAELRAQLGGTETRNSTVHAVDLQQQNADLRLENFSLKHENSQLHEQLLDAEQQGTSHYQSRLKSLIKEFVPRAHIQLDSSSPEDATRRLVALRVAEFQRSRGASSPLNSSETHAPGDTQPASRFTANALRSSGGTVHVKKAVHPQPWKGGGAATATSSSSAAAAAAAATAAGAATQRSTSPASARVKRGRGEQRAGSARGKDSGGGSGAAANGHGWREGNSASFDLTF